MKKLLYIFLFCLGLASVATAVADWSGAATKYVKQAATGAGDGTSCAAATTLTDANLNMDDGDVAVLCTGTFTTTIAPTNSGTDAGNVITFQKDTGATVTFAQAGAYGVNLTNKDWIVIDGLTFTGAVTLKSQIYLSGSSNNEIKNCNFSNSLKNAIRLWTASSYNHIHDNTFDPDGNLDPDGGNYLNDTIYIWHGCDYNRIIDNTFNEGGNHSTIFVEEGDYTVIRGNAFNMSRAFYDSDRTDATYTVSEVIGLLVCNYVLVENNVITYVGIPLPDRQAEQFPFQYLRDKYTITRKNTANNTRGIFYLFTNKWSSSEYNLIYNNTFYHVGDYYTAYGFFDIATVENVYNRYNQFVNNLVHTVVVSKGFNTTDAVPATYAFITDNQFRNNIMYDIGDVDVRHIGTTYTFAEADAASPLANNHIFSGTIETEPTFTSAATGDFTADDGSAPQVDAGAWLTTTTQATASGTQFTVANPYFFYDGWGIDGEVGDTIRTSDAELAIITDITGSTITVDRSISWVANVTGIALDYNGSAPDIGAEEIDVSPPTVPTVSGIPSIAGDGVTVTVTFSEDVVMTGYDANDFDLDCTGTSARNDIGLAYTSGTGTDTIIFTTGATTIYSGDTCTLDFDAAVNADDVEDTTGNDLVTFSDYEITNTSYQNLNMPGIYGVSFQ